MGKCLAVPNLPDEDKKEIHSNFISNHACFRNSPYRAKPGQGLNADAYIEAMTKLKVEVEIKRGHEVKKASKQ